MSNDFESFSKLPSDAQEEAIREGEERVKAQLTVANNADQRALNWARLHLACVTAAFGAFLALTGKSEPDYWLAAIALIFGLMMSAAGWSALGAARPDQDYNLPGNTPSQWLPSPEHSGESEMETMTRTRREQAECLANQIESNAALARSRGNRMDVSYEWTKAAMAIAGAYLLVVGTARVACSLHIQDDQPAASTLTVDQQAKQERTKTGTPASGTSRSAVQPFGH